MLFLDLWISELQFYLLIAELPFPIGISDCIYIDVCTNTERHTAIDYISSLASDFYWEDTIYWFDLSQNEN